MALVRACPRAAALVSPVQQRAARFATYKGLDGMTNYSLINMPEKGTPSVPPEAKPFLGSNLILKWMEGIKFYGLQRTIVQAYTLGDIKFGTCVGEDVNGNRYFENMDYPHGQHRWVEYKDIHNLDASSIPPEWHGWMCHMMDTPGKDAREYIDKKLETKLEIGEDMSGLDHHVGHTEYQMEGLTNWSSFRQRGYNIGGVHQLPGEEDKYHMHAGHAMNKKKKLEGRFQDQKGMHLWDPSDPDGEKIKPPNRPMEEN